ncbi:WXG100 family type VII secretion target [Streptomyces sp. NPDC002896]|uniref:WXG100 family type VII secretion target n=1 Tax=Streptomyces sp. NPDC002896 TaxID=3154438 RepID=UPI003325C855
MADERKLSNDTVVKLEQNIVERYESIKGQLSRLQGTIDTLEAGWRGIGAGAFNKKQTEINEHMVAIGKILEKFLENINLNRKDKDKLEDEIHATIKSIDVDLGGKHSALSNY